MSRSFVITGGASDLATALITRLSSIPDSKTLIVTRTTPCTATLGPNAYLLNSIDLTKERDLELLSNRVTKVLDGQLTIVHFAGDFWRHRPLTKTPLNAFSQMMQSHFISLCGVASVLTPIMINRGGGRLIALSCNSVTYAYPDMSPFTSAKAAIESFIRCYAHEHMKYGITANAIALPTMRTAKVVADKYFGAKENYITPEELAVAITETFSQMGPYTTGNIIRILRYSESFYNKSYFERNPSE